MPGVAPLALRRDRNQTKGRQNLAPTNNSPLAVVCLILFSQLLMPVMRTLWQDENPAPAKSPLEKGEWKIRIHVVDAAGKPIAKARVGKQLGSYDAPVNWSECDQEGRCTLMLPEKDPKYCYLHARANSYTPMRAYWWNAKDRPEDPLPAEFTFEMVKGTAIGGAIVDEEGKPVEGALVKFSGGEFEQSRSRRAQPAFEEHYLTDKHGKWRCEIAPADISSASIHVSHQDFAATTWDQSLDQYLDDLRKLSHRFTLKRGILIQGRVTNQKGEPIAGAALVLCQLNIPHGVPIQVTDKDGKYRFSRVTPPNPEISRDRIALTVSVLKPGYAPAMQTIPGFGDVPLDESAEEVRVVDLGLKPGVSYSFRLVDTKGNPIKGAWVLAHQWRHTAALQELRDHGFPQYTDENGVWKWNDAPSGDKIHFAIQMRGYASVMNHEVDIFEGEEKEAIVMMRPQVITGTVIDTVSKKPIKEFVLERAFERMAGHPDGLSWTSNGIRGKDGKYRGEITLPPHNGSYTYRILADGYEPEVSDSTRFEEGETTINFELTPKSTKK